MDPTACYLILLDAIAEHDYAKAREYASILKHWLDGFGFYPLGFEEHEILDTLGRILRPACDASSLRFPFRAIACRHCNAGDEIDNLEQAIDEGWFRIEPDVDHPSLSHTGLCPECRKLQDDDR